MLFTSMTLSSPSKTKIKQTSPLKICFNLTCYNFVCVSVLVQFGLVFSFDKPKLIDNTNQLFVLKLLNERM